MLFHSPDRDDVYRKAVELRLPYFAVRYFGTMPENTAATESAQKDSGLLQPGFKNKVTAFQMNPFVKYRGLEVFGVLEQSKGKASTEATERTTPFVGTPAPAAPCGLQPSSEAMTRPMTTPRTRST